MKIASLILEYIGVLIWPALLMSGLLVYRKEIKDLVRKLAELQLPGGATARFHSLPPDAQDFRRSSELQELTGVESSQEYGVETSPEGTIPANNMRELEIRVQRAKDLVMKQLELEFEIELRRQVSYNNRPDLQFEGYGQVDHVVKLIEVKYLNAYRDLRETADFEFAKFDRMCAEVPDVKIAGVLVFVADVDQEDLQRIQMDADAIWRRKYRAHDIRVYHMVSLEHKLGGAVNR